jgi:hypothetical protein
MPPLLDHVHGNACRSASTIVEDSAPYFSRKEARTSWFSESDGIAAPE